MIIIILLRAGVPVGAKAGTGRKDMLCVRGPGFLAPEWTRQPASVSRAGRIT